MEADACTPHKMAFDESPALTLDRLIGHEDRRGYAEHADIVDQPRQDGLSRADFHFRIEAHYTGQDVPA